MAYECVWFDEIPDRPFEPGWCLPIGYFLSRHFREHVAGTRPPIAVIIPTRDGSVTTFCVDSFPTDKPESGWTVTLTGPLVNGEKPPLTVHPSLHAIGLYHGTLTDGVLSDDLDAPKRPRRTRPPLRPPRRGPRQR